MIPVNEPLIGENERQYLLHCLTTGWISSEGSYVSEFENRLAAKVGRKFGIALANGSVALDTAVAALGIGSGDSVIIPAFTIISCAAAVVRAGALPIVVDADPNTWNVDLNLLDEAVKREIKRTDVKLKAIMVVHIYGLPVDMKPVIDLAQKYGLKIIEDAAEMIGQTCRGRDCGSFGEISTFSFYANKHITTGEGGMIVTDDPKIAEKCRNLRNLYFDAERRYIHEEIGWNFRFTNIQAALGVAQLEHLDESVKRKRNMGERYSNLLKNLSGLQLPVEKTEYADNIYWVYGIVLNDEVSFDACEAMKRLQECGIATRHFFWPMNLQPCLKKRGLFLDVKCPVAERLALRGFYLPSGLALSDEQLVTTVKAVKEILT